jgi:hypothetical protein
MDLSRGPGIVTKRWVVDHVTPATVRMAKTIAVEYDMRVAEVLETAVNQLWDKIFVEQELPDGWKEP